MGAMTFMCVTPVFSTDAPAFWSGPSTRSLVATTFSTVHTIFQAGASSFSDVAAKGFNGAIRISVGATILRPSRACFCRRRPFLLSGRVSKACGLV
jgi:hypothetical protein